MFPRTGSTLMGEFGLSPGIVPAPARPPFNVCADTATPAASSAASVSALHLPRIAGTLPGGRLRRRRVLQLLAVLGIHRLRSAAGGFERNTEIRAELL